MQWLFFYLSTSMTPHKLNCFPKQFLLYAFFSYVKYKFLFTKFPIMYNGKQYEQCIATDNLFISIV